MSLEGSSLGSAKDDSALNRNISPSQLIIYFSMNKEHVFQFSGI